MRPQCQKDIKAYKFKSLKQLLKLILHELNPKNLFVEFIDTKPWMISKHIVYLKRLCSSDFFFSQCDSYLLHRI